MAVELTREAGLEVASYGSYYRFDECAEGSQESGPEMAAVLKTAEALGAPAIRLWAGRTGPEDMPDREWEAIVDRARAFAEKAANRGMRIEFEFHENTLTETPHSTNRLLDAISHPAAWTLWQPPLQTLPSDRLEGLRLVKARVSNLHCNFFAQDPWPEVHALAEGESEWKSYLNELDPAVGRWVLIEHVKDHSVAQLAEDAGALRRWLSLYRK